MVLSLASLGSDDSTWRVSYRRQGCGAIWLRSPVGKRPGWQASLPGSKVDTGPPWRRTGECSGNRGMLGMFGDLDGFGEGNCRFDGLRLVTDCDWQL